MIPPIALQTGREIGFSHPTYIVAEVGSNHDGNFEKAKRLIDLAKDVGADAIKFQSFHADKLLNQEWLHQGNWEKNPLWEMYERLSLPDEWHAELQQYAALIGIDFLSTPFDIDSVKLLVDLDVPVIKIASGDLTYHDMLKEVGKSRKPVFLSTGASTLEEIDAAVQVLRGNGCRHLVLLQCVLNYPAQLQDVNIRAMLTLLSNFEVLVGYSDHGPRSIVPIGAVALGACVLEKHLTDDKSLPGPDHRFALDREEFSHMVALIRQMEAALGDGLKQPTSTELEEIVASRRGLYAAEDIPEGSILSRERIKVVRSCYPEGIPASQLDEVLGKRTKETISKNTLLTWDLL